MEKKKGCTNKSISTLQDTIILEENDREFLDYPHCKLPTHFFDQAQKKSTHQRDILSIATWSGRRVFSIEGSKH
jgi:hypothetical protein